MTDASDRLQDSLEKLEAGAAPEALSAQMPEEEAQLMQLAATLRSAPWPSPSPAKAQMHKQVLLRLVQERKRPMSSSSSKRIVFGGAALALGALGIVAACLVVGLGAAFFWMRSTGAPVAQKGPAPQSALVQDVRGLVEVQTNGWRPAGRGLSIAVGVPIRTGVLSGATLVLGDGSQVRLGPVTEIAFAALDTPANGPRVVRMKQFEGESDHTVAHSANPASVYEVQTPAGGGTAKGTVFHVQTAADGRSRFDVQEGAVAVSNQAVTVMVLAGQSTQVLLDEPPVAPSFLVTGEGAVTQMGEAWVVAGRPFAVDSATEVIGDPQLGDWVKVEGRLLAGGAAQAERIVLVRRAAEDRFAFAGGVESVSATQWVIAGRPVNVDAHTQIAAGLGLGILVKVEGRLSDDGTLWADSLEPAASGFDFAGVVQSIGASEWRIADITVTVGVSTTIAPDLKVGDSVQVTGSILANGAWLAQAIQPAKVTRFAFTGVVVRLNPWNVSGVELTADANTDIDAGIQVGNRVQVAGRVLPDGTWLAESIAQLDEGQRHAIQFTARVESLSPWVVGGVTVTVDAKTKITGDIKVGDLVLVKGNLLPNGAVVANTITPITEMTGCMENAGIIATVQLPALTLADGLTLTVPSTVKVTGNVRPGSVILIRSCLNETGELVVVSLTVLHQIDTLPTPVLTPTLTITATPGITSTLLAPTDEKVTICHNASKNNPHTITVDRSALPAHLAHGDVVGPCVSETLTLTPTLTLTSTVTLTPSATLPATPTVLAPKDDKVTVCHNAGKKNPHTLTIDRSALPAHLGHGDTLGACP
jgi:hypothetical protein